MVGTDYMESLTSLSTVIHLQVADKAAKQEQIQKLSWKSLQDLI